MKGFRIFRQIGRQVAALLMGVLLSFSLLRGLNAQAVTITQIPNSSTIELSKVPADLKAESFVAMAVARTGAAVVRIDTEAVITRRYDPLFNDPFFGDFFSRLPSEQRVNGQGSGFIVDPSGIILTNAHVVSNADKVTVTLKDGRTFNGEVKGTDEVTDLAVVKIDTQGEKLPIAPLGDSSQLQVGDWAIAVGNPVGLDNTVTLGIISTLSRSAAKVGIPDKRIDFIQTDAAINPGNSGGPLLNAQGEVIGINTAIRADALGIGFAIPINKAKALEPRLASGQKVAHPYIGVQMTNLTPELAKDNNEDPNSPLAIPEVEGILIVKVLPNTPAEKAGLRRGDVILESNNERIKDGTKLQTIVEEIGLNQTIQLTIQRDNKILDIPVRTAQLEGS